MKKRHVVSRLCATLFALAAVCAHGQTAARPPLTAVAEVRALDAIVAGRNPSTVKLRGTVTEVGVTRDSFTIHSGTDGIGVMLAAGALCPALGDDVEVDGETMTFAVAGFSHPRVRAGAVRVAGKGKLPEPLKLGLVELNSFRHFERWVSVEGHVLRWKFRPSTNELVFSIAAETTWTTCTVRTEGRPDLVSRLMRAKVRVTGINAGVTTHDANGALIAPSLAQLEILTPGSGSSFDAPLVSIQEVNERRFDPGTRVRVRAVVAAQRSFQCYLRGEGGAQLDALQSPWEREAGSTDELADAGAWPALKPGDEVEFVGSASVVPNYALIYGDVRVIGKGGIAPAEHVDVEAMKAGRYTDNWITLDARVFAWTRQGELMLYSVWDPHDNVTIHVPTPVTPAFPDNLHGAKVRFTGIANRTAAGTSYHIPGPAYFGMLEPGTADPFAVPEQSPADIASARVPLPSDAPMKFRGQVIGLVGNDDVHVRCAGSALRVKLQPPSDRAAKMTGRAFADDGSPSAIQEGDGVEVMGWAIRPGTDSRIAGYDLVGCKVRVIDHAERPPPVATTLARIVRGEHTSDLVQVRARLLAISAQPVEHGEWRTTMLLKSSGARVAAIHQSALLHPFDTLKTDDDVLLQAVVEKGTAQSPPQLRLLSTADAKSLGLSPDIFYLRLWVWGGGAAALLALFSGWIVALRRSNRVKSEVAVLLEQRVKERTEELQKAQAGLSRTLDQERELGELKSRFVSMVSHEFRTPLGITMSAIELMRHYDDRLPPEKRKELQQDVFDATRHMADLMEQVLLLGSVEAGKLGFKAAACDLEMLAGRLADECLSATGRKCAVVWRAGSNLSGTHADESLLRHIFSNLLTNAVKYSPAGSEVVFAARREGDDAVFEVSDHGIGIPENDRAQLFEAFHRCSNVGDIPGTGLGLVIVKRCVVLHGGSIAVQSEVGSGTTFIVRLPVFAPAS